VKVFNLLELAYNNTIQVRHKVTEGDVVENHRCVVDSRQDLTNAPQLIQDIAAAFPFTEFENPDGACCHADFIRVLDGNRGAVRYNIFEYIYKNGTEVDKRSTRPSVVVDCLEDITAHPEKVQKFCAVIFTPEVKAAYIASLPTVDVKVAGETTTETVKVPAVTEKQVVDGVLTDVVIEEAREEKREVQATQAFIQYKGELYASARDLL